MIKEPSVPLELKYQKEHQEGFQILSAAWRIILQELNRDGRLHGRMLRKRAYQSDILVSLSSFFVMNNFITERDE